MFRCVNTINNRVFVYNSEGKRVPLQSPEVQAFLKRPGTQCASSSSLQMIEARQDKNDLLYLVKMAKEEAVNAQLMQQLLTKTLAANEYNIRELKQAFMGKQQLKQRLENADTSKTNPNLVSGLISQLQNDLSEIKRLVKQQQSQQPQQPQQNERKTDVVQQAIDFTKLQKEYEYIKQQLNSKANQIQTMEQNIEVLNQQIQTLYPVLDVSSKIIPSYFEEVKNSPPPRLPQAPASGDVAATESITEETAQKILELQETNELLLKQLNEESNEVLRLTKKQNELMDELQKYKTFLSLEEQKQLDSKKTQSDILAALQRKNENLESQLIAVQQQYEQVKLLSEQQLEELNQKIERMATQQQQLEEVQQVNDQYEILFESFNQCLNNSKNIKECLQGVVQQPALSSQSSLSRVPEVKESPLPAFDSQGVLRGLGTLSTGPKISPISKNSLQPQKNKYIDLGGLGDSDDLEEDLDFLV
jgi:DNA repair exonuclease SbcCD ATPase subunit